MTCVMGVTGSTGVIGSALVRLAHGCGYDVRCFSRGDDGCELLDLAADRIDPRLFERCDVVVHLAARLPPSITDDAEARACWEINALGTLKLLEALREAGVSRLIQATAANAYASWCEFPDEHAPLYPQSKTYYLASKVLQEMYAHSYGAAHDIAVTSLRISSPYAPHPTRNTVGRLANSLLTGQTVRLQHGGSFGADFIAVSDIAKAIILLEDAGAAGVWNVATGTRHTMREIAQMLLRLTEASESQIELEPESETAFAGYPAIDIGKIRNIGFAPADIESGLRAVVDELQITCRKRRAINA